MKNGHGKTKWAMALVPVLAMSWALATLAAEPLGRSASPFLSLNRCERYVGSVSCARNRTPGGPVGCFDTLCEAAAAGAYQCRRLESSCEPH
jgi:hypothetical protein